MIQSTGSMLQPYLDSFSLQFALNLIHSLIPQIDSKDYDW